MGYRLKLLPDGDCSFDDLNTKAFKHVKMTRMEFEMLLNIKGEDILLDVVAVNNSMVGGIALTVERNGKQYTPDLETAALIKDILVCYIGSFSETGLKIKNARNPFS